MTTAAQVRKQTKIEEWLGLHTLSQVTYHSTHTVVGKRLANYMWKQHLWQGNKVELNGRITSYFMITQFTHTSEKFFSAMHSSIFWGRWKRNSSFLRVPWTPKSRLRWPRRSYREKKTTWFYSACLHISLLDGHKQKPNIQSFQTCLIHWWKWKTYWWQSYKCYERGNTAGKVREMND